MLSRFLSSMNYSFLSLLPGVQRTPFAVNRTVRVSCRINEVVMLVASYCVSRGAGTATYLTDESGSRFVNVVIGCLD
jgi:hypothetical protein